MGSLLERSIKDLGFRPETQEMFSHLKTLGDLVDLWRSGGLSRMKLKHSLSDVVGFLASVFYQVVDALGRQATLDANKGKPLWMLPVSSRLGRALEGLSLETLGDFLGYWLRDPMFDEVDGIGKTSIQEALLHVARISMVDRPQLRTRKAPKPVPRGASLDVFLTELGVGPEQSVLDVWLKGDCFKSQIMSRFLFREFAQRAAEEFVARRDRLAKFDEKQPVVVFAFGKRGVTGLAHCRVKTAGDLVNYWVKDPSLAEVPKLGDLSRKEIYLAINGLVLGKEDLLMVPDGPVLERLYEIVQFCNEGRRGVPTQVLSQRFGLGNFLPMTLDDIGRTLGVTRERVRQLEEQLVARLKAVLIHRQMHRGARVPEGLSEQVRRFQLELAALGSVFEEQNLVEVVNRCFGEESALRSPNLTLLLFVLGYRELPSNAQIFSEWRFWVREGYDLADEVLIAMKMALAALKEEEFVEKYTLRMNLRKNYPHIPFTCLDLALVNCPYIQEVGGAYRLSRSFTSDLRWSIIQFLRSVKKPVHFRDILEHVNQLRMVHDTREIGQGSIGNILSGDSAFIPIGRTGKWGLSSWRDVCGGTGVELITDFLKEKGAPASRDEVWAYVAARRDDIPKNTIFTYLNGHKNFMRLASNSFALTEWGLEPGPRMRGNVSRVDKEDLLQEVARYISEIPSQEVRYARLLEHLRNTLNCGESFVNNTLSSCSKIHITRKPGHPTNRMVRLVDYTPGQQFFDLSEKMLQVRVREMVLGKFAEQPAGILLSDLAKAGEQEVGCQRPTFYSYIKKVPGLTKKTLDGKVWCFYEPPAQN